MAEQPSSSPESNWTPAQRRKHLLDFFAVTEDLLDKLRWLDPTEARWRIRHEHVVQLDWTNRRRVFLLQEVFGHAPVGTEPTVSRHHVDGTDVEGASCTHEECPEFPSLKARGRRDSAGLRATPRGTEGPPEPRRGRR